MIKAIYEKGVLKPLEPVDLKEGEEYLVIIERIPNEELLSKAIDLFLKGEVSVGRGAEIVGIPIADFLKELSKRKISINNWSEKEIEEEFKTASDIGEK